MNTLIRNLRPLAILAAVLALPHLASAAKSFATFTISPNSASVVAGVATNVTAVETVLNGSAASTRYVGPATFTTSISPAEPTISVSLNPGTLTFPAATTTLMSTCTVSTASITPSGTYFVKIVINTNPPNANVIPSTNTFTLNVGAVFVPLKTWTPAGVNTNWSTAANWTATGAPTPSNDVLFVDLGAAGTAGLVDNVADSTQTIGSLTYGQTNGFHTTLIGPGLAVTVGGDANGLSVGTGSDIGDGQLTTAAITGTGGTLSVTNPGSTLTIDQSHTTAGDAIAQSQATLDLSSLGSLNATVSRVLVGVDSTAALKGASGVLNFAQTNIIALTTGSAAPQFDIGDNSQSQGSPGKASTLLLGQTNAIFADSISVGRGKTDNTAPSMSFNNIFTSPTAYFRGTNGSSSRVGTWSIGDGFGSKSAIVNANGICDFSAGSVNALVNTMFIGKGASVANGSGANVFGIGILTLSAGNFDVNTLEAGFMQTAPGTGTVNVNGGTLLVNSLLELGHSGGSGTLNISAGSAILNSGATAGGGTANITMTGGTLVATNPTATLGTGVSPLTTFAVANGTLTLAVRSISPTIDTGTLNGGGLVNTINISSAPVLTNVPVQFPVIQYTTAQGDLTTFVIGTLPGTYQGYISNNTTTSSIDLVITNGPIFPVMVWDGSQNGNWDVGTFNWKTNGVLTAYQQNYPIVRFDDSLTGTTNVILTTSLTPGSLTIGNTLSNYVFTGAGSLGGSLTLLDSGSGSLTLAETGGDNFTGGIDVNGGGTVVLDNANASMSGGTTIDNGTVQIGMNDAKGSLPSGGVAVAGTLAINRLNTLNVTNAISGAGTISQIGTGGAILSGNNSTFSGSVSITQGTLQVGNTNGVGSSPSVTITSGTFDVGGFALFGNGNSALVVTVAGSGVGGNGAIINSGISQTKVFHTVTLTADTTFGGTGDWDIRNSSGNSSPADAALNGAFNLTKVNTNSLSFRGVTVDGGLGNINVQGGSVTFTATATAPQNSLGNSSATITVFSNATITLDTIGTIPGKNMVLTNGGTFKSSGTNTFSSQLTLLGAANNTINVGTAAQLTITTPIGGAGGFAKNGSSTLFLNVANTYNGSTVVSGGILALYGNALDGSISASASINVTAGAILDVSGRSDQTLTLANGQTLSGGTGTNGVGLITGFLAMNSGATLAPGNSPTNTGVLVVSSNATLSGATIMKLNAGAGTNDLFAANALSYGGSLTVTNFNGTITNGQTFQLFIASNGVYNAASFSGLTLPSATGLTWTNNLTSNGTITAGVASTTPAQPRITSVSLTGTSLVISGTNGTAGQQFEVLSSTNVALALSNWTSIATNTFSSGNFSVTNTVNPAVSPSFFILRVP